MLEYDQMIEIDKEEVKKKRATLDGCRSYLKSEFIGIDVIIDDLLDYLQVWYLMPEILNRPIILNLWGMTGVGKTDLIRKMVKYLNYQDRFTEVELSNTDQSGWSTSVAQILNNNMIDDGEPAIVLFDEIQRFNTLDTDGTPLPKTKYSDFWELLSDGRLSKKQREDLDIFLFNYMNNRKNAAQARARGEEVPASQNLSVWDARTLRDNLGLNLGIGELAEMTEDQMIDIILKAKREKKIYEPVDHSKTLIIISGNLDEAFRMAAQTSEADVDADIYHAFTKKITIVDIKNALTRKFRPEQVARFGNIHLIYHSLRRIDFERLIQKEIDRIIGNLRDKLGIELTVGRNINELIYNNGVFPVQGVRPVFSSVIDILEANLSKFLFEAITNGEQAIHVTYEKEEKQIVARFGERRVAVPYVGRIDKIRQANEADAVANISVHESGHAVAYMAVTGMAPLQLKSKVASSYAGGFTFPHQIHATRRSILDKIRVYLAGGLAEELVFGAENASTGRSHDREEATVFAIEFIRKYGFDENFQAVYNMEAGYLSMDHSVTDAHVEKLISGLVVDTRALLEQHADLLLSLSKVLGERGSLNAAEIAQLAGEFGLSVTIKEEGYLHIHDYHRQLNDNQGGHR